MDKTKILKLIERLKEKMEWDDKIGYYYVNQVYWEEFINEIENG